jgi:hypothetical protein
VGSDRNTKKVVILMRGRFVFLLILPALLLIAAPAQARHAVQVDMSDFFNADVIVNGTTTENVDTTQTTVDISETSWITQGAASVLDNCTGDPDGLPNRGRFAENDLHPFVDLGYENSSNGRNAHRSPDADSYTVPVPRYRYRAVHIFAASGNGDSTMKVRLNFVEGNSIQATRTVPDWYGATSDGYALIDDRDRAHPDGSECYDDNNPAMFGFKIGSDSDRKLKSVRISRPSGDGESVLTVYGITGRRVGSH